MAARKKTPRKPAGSPAAKKGAAKKVARRVSAPSERRVHASDEETVREISETAKRVHQSIAQGGRPDLALPVRALSNVSYDEKRGYLEIGRQRKIRTLSVNTVKSFAQTLRLMSLSKELVEGNDFATKREAYYISKNWDDAKFDDQVESDATMDDIEALFSISAINHGLRRA